MLDSFELRVVADHVMAALMEGCSEAIHLGILVGRSVMYLHKVDPPHILRVHTQVGTVMPGYSTAVGKAILAYASETAVESVLIVPFVRLTPNTCTTAAESPRTVAAGAKTRVRGR